MSTSTSKLGSLFITYVDTYISANHPATYLLGKHYALQLAITQLHIFPFGRNIVSCANVIVPAWVGDTADADISILVV